ncbi:MAG: periplasmic heavy metal sensor [Chthoniobacteraceae bacterium]|nr:periplasmic heavy metal sensor [Chthoniobacteraceae bacterium]
MKRPLLLLLAALAAAVLGYGIVYELATRPAKAMLAHPDCGMVWLRQEYHLSPEQFAKVEQMHTAYRPTCEAMCMRIAAAREKVDALIAANPAVTPETEAALREWALVQNDCRVAMLRHVYAVSAVMSPADGKRYVAMASGRLVETGMAHTALLDQ